MARVTQFVMFGSSVCDTRLLVFDGLMDVDSMCVLFLLGWERLEGTRYLSLLRSAEA